MSHRARAAAIAACLLVALAATAWLVPHTVRQSALPGPATDGAAPAARTGSLPIASTDGRSGSRPALQRTRLHAPRDEAVAQELVAAGTLNANATPDQVAAAISAWRTEVATVNPAWRTGGDTVQALAHEQRALTQAPSVRVPVTAAVLVVPVEFGSAADLTYRVQNAQRECITVTRRFTGPLHGLIAYPGGSAATTIDNQTVYYPSTEPDDIGRLIFGREGYTLPLRAGDPNVNDGRGADISGLTVQSYFDAQSDGTVQLTGAVAPWVALPQPEAYFGLNRCLAGMSSRAMPDEAIGSLGELAAAAVEGIKAKGGVYATYDYWKQFDADGDGVIDTLWLMHAGRGEEYGGGTEGDAALWSRASDIRSYPESGPDGLVVHDNGTATPTDDIRVGPFTILPEDSDIGVLIEEFGHAYFGFPDLYTNDAANSVGWWAPMSSGIWGGELGGTRPVNMPLWYRMIADCRDRPCGWADPVAAISLTQLTEEGETFVLGQAGTPSGGQVSTGAFAGQTINEGLRIDLPTQLETVPNNAGPGGGAYSGSTAGIDLSLVREIDLTGVITPAVMTFDAYWRIRNYFGYAHVEVSPDGEAWQSLPDMDGKFTADNPYGTNDGYGLTGNGQGALRFDLSAFAGQKVHLRFRYMVYLDAPRTGWWIDNVRIPGVLDEGFSNGLAGWMTEMWKAVPYVQTHPHYYLVEWRNAVGFDKSLLGAYATSYQDADEWRVDRIAANVPGAVVWYRNTKYPFSASLLPGQNDAPSIGAKYGLLVVDTNFWPIQRPSGRPLSAGLGSLDGALAFGRQPDFALEVRDPASGALLSTDRISGTDGVDRFDDARGYVPGYYQDPAQPQATPAPWQAAASVVVPSRDGQVYRTRITAPDRSRPHPKDGQPAPAGNVYGSGNPGELDVHNGVHVDLVEQAADGSWGVVRVHNRDDFGLWTERATVSAGEDVRYTVMHWNRDPVRHTVAYSVTLPAGITLAAGTSTGVLTIEPGQVAYAELVGRVGSSGIVDPSQHLAAQVVFDDGTEHWLRHATVHASLPRIYLPVANNR